MSGLVGLEEMKFTRSSKTAYGVGKIDVAMIFDVSGSMSSQNRIKDLRSAATDAIDILLPAEKSDNTGEIRVAMSSYAHTVNLGAYFTAITGEQPTRTYPLEKANRKTRCTQYHTSGSKKGQCKKTETYTEWEPDTKSFTNTCSFQRGGPGSVHRRGA